MAKPRIMFDHDGRHPLVYMYEPPMYKEEFEAAIDELVGTPVEAVNLMIGDIGSLIYDSQVGGLWGKDVDRWPHSVWGRASRNFNALIAEGYDPLKIACDRAHSKGMSLYAQLLAQQGAREISLRVWEDDEFSPEDYKYDVQSLEIGASGKVDKEWPGYRCLDFMHEEVRSRTLSLVEELVNNYSIDGLELEFCYTPYYFRPDQIESGRKVMTEWIGSVHEVMSSGSTDRELAVQVPASVDAGLSIGLDLNEWIRTGIVDVIIAQPSVVADPMADFKPLINASRGTNTRVLAALKSRVSTDRINEASIEMMRGSACNYWDQGVDGIYVAHWFGYWPYASSFYEKLRELPHPDIMASRDKHYRVPTDTVRPVSPSIAADKRNSLPVKLKVSVPNSIELIISDDVEHWYSRGMIHEILLRIRLVETNEQDKIEVKLNGNLLPSDMLRRVINMYAMDAPQYRVNGACWYIFRLRDEFRPVKGTNIIEVNLLESELQAFSNVTLRDIEMEIKYLKGAGFGRGTVDPDLGSYEYGTQ